MTTGAADTSGDALERTLPIRNERGLHARAAAKFVQTAGAYSAEITVSKDGQSVSGLSIMGLMMLAAGIGTEIAVHARGDDAPQALDALAALVDEKFGEEA